MKYVNNIKSGLEVSRLNRIPCRTTQIEDEIKKNIIPVKGSLLSEPEKEVIIRKEKKRIQKQAQAIKKARLKILKKKEATTIIQKVRRGEYTANDTVMKRADKIRSRPGRYLNAIDVMY